MKFVKAFIFDIDGTLLDSNEAHAVTWWEAFGDDGIRIDLERVRHAVGMGADHLVPSLTDLPAESERAEKIGREKGRRFKREYFDSLRPFPEARELVVTLRERGYRLAVATSADREEMESFLTIVGATELFDVKISADDVGGSKPDPELVAAALRKLDVKASEALMVGDTPYDIEAARKANVRTLAVRSGGFTDAELAGAAAIYSDVAEIHRRVREGETLAE
jgi:HAD superfamily hydrolase (TIGR01509 family)